MKNKNFKKYRVWIQYNIEDRDLLKIGFLLKREKKKKKIILQRRKTVVLKKKKKLTLHCRN